VRSSICSLLSLASVVICLIVVASFGIFAVDQTSSASSNQQQQLSVGLGTGPGTAAGTGTAASAGTGAATNIATQGSPTTSSPHKNSLRTTIENASNKLTSPFSAITEGSNSEWAVHGVDLLLSLIVYGFGLGYLARVIRMGM
jgi:hypothetical protein